MIWQSSVAMIRDFPVTGAGFGSFRHVFARYMPEGESLRWAHAHNDYLELLLDGGFVALGLFVWLALGYGRRVVKHLRRSSPISPGRIGLTVGVVSLAIHAVLDFNYQIPATALVFVTFCALLLPVGREDAPEDGS